MIINIFSILNTRMYHQPQSTTQSQPLNIDDVYNQALSYINKHNLSKYDMKADTDKTMLMCNVMIIAVTSNDLNFVKYLYEIGCPYTDVLTINVVMQDKADILKYLLSVNVQVSSACLPIASERGSLECVEMLLPKVDDNTVKVRSAAIAASKGRLDILKLILAELTLTDYSRCAQNVSYQQDTITNASCKSNMYYVTSYLLDLDYGISYATLEDVCRLGHYETLERLVHLVNKSNAFNLLSITLKRNHDRLAQLIFDQI